MPFGGVREELVAMTRLRETRKTKNLSLRELQRLTLVHPSQLCRYEHGLTAPLSTAQRIAKSMGVTLDSLTGQ